jgi:hypothetical protein
MYVLPVQLSSAPQPSFAALPAHHHTATAIASSIRLHSQQIRPRPGIDHH